MASTPFVALEDRLNRAVERRLANSQGVYQGGPPFSALYGRDTVSPFGVVDAARITLSFLASRAPGLATGHEITVDGVPHIVSSEVQPDASGWLVVELYVKES